MGIAFPVRCCTHVVVERSTKNISDSLVIALLCVGVWVCSSFLKREEGGHSG